MSKPAKNLRRADEAAARALHAERAGNGEQAAVQARAALAFAPQHLVAHEILCRLSAAAGDHVGAATHALTAWGLSPDDQTRRGNLWQLFTHMGTAEQADELERRLQREPGAADDCVLTTAAANALRRDGRPLRAELLYRRALARRPDVFPLYSRLACLCAEQHRLEEADALFQEAARRGGGRDVVTRVAPSFMAELRAGPPAPGLKVDIRQGSGVNDRPLIVYVACDSVYLQTFGPSLVRSLFANAGLDCALALHVVNPDAAAEAALTALTTEYGVDRFIIIRETVDLSAFGAQARTWYACSRFLLLPDLMQHYRRPFLLLDADLMPLRDLNPLLAAGERADFALMSHALKRLDVWSLLYADVVHVRPTPAALDFFDMTRRYVARFLKPGEAHWFLDQAAMAGVWLGGYVDRPAPRVVWHAPDIHSSNLMVAANGDYWCDDAAYFYSVRASAGGARTVAKALRRAGTVAELQTTQPAAAGDGSER